MSSSTTSGRYSGATSTAASPSCTALTSYPQRVSRSTRVTAASRLSSTTRTRVGRGTGAAAWERLGIGDLGGSYTGRAVHRTAFGLFFNSGLPRRLGDKTGFAARRVPGSSDVYMVKKLITRSQNEKSSASAGKNIAPALRNGTLPHRGDFPASKGDLSCHLPRCVASFPPPCSSPLSPSCRRPSRPAPSRSGTTTPPSPRDSRASTSWEGSGRRSATSGRRTAHGSTPTASINLDRAPALGGIGPAPGRANLALFLIYA